MTQTTEHDSILYFQKDSGDIDMKTENDPDTDDETQSSYSKISNAKSQGIKQKSSLIDYETELLTKDKYEVLLGETFDQTLLA